MPKMEVKGLDELIRKTEQMGRNPTGYVKRALYEGVAVMFPAIESAVASIPTDEEYGTPRKKRKGISAEEKAELVAALGRSRMEVKGETVNISIGFKGKNEAAGVKNSTVMRRVESGTSYMVKHPTIRPAANRTRTAAFAAMQEQFERDLKEQFE